MIKFIVTVKNDFSKVLLQEITREQLLGACRMEDTVQSTEEEKSEVLTCLEYYFNDTPFIINGRISSINDALYSSFFYISASPLVRRWVEENNQSFGITLELDLVDHTTKILCSSINDWLSINRLISINDFRTAS